MILEAENAKGKSEELDVLNRKIVEAERLIEELKNVFNPKVH